MLTSGIYHLAPSEPYGSEGYDHLCDAIQRLMRHLGREAVLRRIYDYSVPAPMQTVKDRLVEIAERVR